MADFNFQQSAPTIQELLNSIPDKATKEELEQLRELYEALTQSEIIPVPSADWPVSDPHKNVIYRVAGTSSYTDYMWNGTSFIPIATYDNAPTDIPAVGSTDVITAGGVANHGSAFDISEYNKNGATLATYADLSAALSETNVPESVRKGGMSVKFVQTSDNKYVQYFLTKNEWSTNEADWQKMNLEEEVSQLGQKEDNYYNVPIKENSGSMEDVYTSESDNYLDVDNVAHGVYLDARTNGTPTANAKGVISRFIYVKGISQVTASGYVNSAYLGILFLSKPVLDVQYRTNYYQLTNTSRTISVPANSLYAVVCLVEPDYDDDYDYSGVKLSFTSSAATQAYKGVYLGRAGYEYLFNKNIATANDIAEIPTIREELDDVDSVSTKTISVTKNSVISQSASMLILPVTIKRGSKYKACVRDTNGCVSKIDAIYIVPKGSSDPVTFAANVLPNTFTSESTANVEISAICIYCLAGSVVGSGDIVLSVYNGDLEIENRVHSLENTLSDYNKEYTCEIAGSASISQSQSMTPVDIKQGEKFSVEIVTDSGNITGVDAIYAVYHGSDSPQNLGIISPEINRKYNFTATNDIDYICLYAGGSTIHGSFDATLVIKGSGLVQRVEELPTDVSDQEYKEIFKQTSNDALQRFIPFSLTTPTNRVHQEDVDFRRNFNMAFFTDSHVDYKCPEENQQNVKDVVAFVNAAKSKIALNLSTPNRQLFDVVLHSGDIISGGAGMTKTQAKNNAKKFFDATKELNVPFVFAPGNHDRNDDGNPPSSAFTFEDWAELYGDYAASHYGIVRGTKSGNPCPWCYRDFADKKIRVVSVFINDVDESKTDGNGNVLYNETHGWYIAQDQMDWLVETALDFSDKDDTDWGVIVLIHQSIQVLWNNKWYDCRVSPAFDSSIQKFFEVCKAFNAQGTYINNYTFETDSFFDLEIDADFTSYASKKGWDSHTWTQISGTNKGAYFECFRKKEQGLTVNMVDSGNMTNYHVYVKYVGDDDNTHLATCTPNQETTLTLAKDIESVYVYINSIEITGNVSATFKILQLKPHIICWLNGHEHWDGNRIVTGTDNNGVAQYGTIEDGGINIIWTAQNAAMMAYSDFSKPRLLGTATQNLFDLISIDTLRRKIRMVRVGAGVNCFGGGMPYGDRFLPDGIDY